MTEYFSSEDHLISSQTDIQINMEFLIYFSLYIVAISSAQQLKNGPLIITKQLSSSNPTQKFDEHYVKPEFNLYFTPEEIQALQAMQTTQNSGSFETLKQKPEISEESYNELLQKFFAENLKKAPIEESQAGQRHSSSNLFLPKQESIYNNKPDFNVNSYKQLLMDQTKLSRYSQRNKLDQLPLFKPASDSNKNKDQRKSLLEKEKEYILRNGKIYQSKPLNSPIQVLSQNSERNVAQENAAIEKEIENAWRQYEAHEFERLNSPAEIRKRILSARNENNKEEKPITYILRNDQAYGFERSNAPTETNTKGSQNRNEGQKESEVERETEHFWGKQQDSQLQTSFLPAGVFNHDPSGINENKEKSEVDKQIENIFKQQDFGFDRLYSPADVSLQRPSGKNENQGNLKIGQPFELIFKKLDDESEREKAPEVNNQSPLVTNRDKNRSDVDKEIQNILKKHQDFEFQSSKVAEAINQSPPIQIHEHVSVTKHIPVPVIKTVQVAVPTPVLVPIPQPYEVKIPHLYPVPLKKVKDVPVSLVRHY